MDTDSFLVELTSKIRARWAGTGKELHSLLQRPEGEKYWPEPRGMAGKLRRVAPDLRKAGWSVEEIESRLKGKAKTWVLTPPGGGAVPDTDLMKVHMIMQLHQQDLAAWERQLQLDGATRECMTAHASSASAGAELLCRAPGCKASWRPEYQARVERSKVISSELHGALDKAGVSWSEVEQLIAERGLAV